MNKIQFVPECFADTEFVKILFMNGKHRSGNDFDNHAAGISNVSGILKKRDIEGYVNIGFVDADKKNVPAFLEEFEEIDSIENVFFKKHPETNDYLIVLKPAIEKFLISQMNEIGKSPLDFELPEDFKRFKKTLKSQQIEHNKAYKSMLNALKDQNPSGIDFIQKKVESLRKQPLS